MNNETDEDSQGSADDASTTPLYSGHGGEEGAGPYFLSDSGGSSTGKAGRYGRKVKRPESFIYINLDNINKSGPRHITVSRPVTSARSTSDLNNKN